MSDHDPVQEALRAQEIEDQSVALALDLLRKDLSTRDTYSAMDLEALARRAMHLARRAVKAVYDEAEGL